MQMSKKVAVFLGDLLFAMALSCAILILKADPVKDGAIISCVRRKISVSMTTKGSFWRINMLPFCFV